MKSLFKNNTFQVIICICLVLILISGLVVSSALTAGGKYQVKNVEIQFDGYSLEGSLFIPKAALEKGGEFTRAQMGDNVNKVPAIVTQGGGSANRYFQYAHVIELVKRGFVVFAIDAYTHGTSDNYPDGWSAYSQIHDALKYVHNLNFVDDSQVGYLGHSQGGSAAMQAAAVYGGYLTEQDMLINLLHDELGVEITAEDVAAQDADAIAAKLDDYEKGLYEARKGEVIEEYEEKRVSFALMEGMATGAAPPIGIGGSNTITPEVVEVGGIPVLRNIQCNIGNSISMGDEALSQNSLPLMLISSTKELPIGHTMRALHGTGEDAVQLRQIYSVNESSTEEAVPSTIIGEFNADSWKDPTVRAAADNHTLRMLNMFPGWHNTNHFNQNDISTVANYISVMTGFNNGYYEKTNGAGAVAFDDTKTWQTALVFNNIGFLALLLLAVSVVAVILNKKSPVVCEALEPQASKKDPKVWIFTAIVVLLPTLLITPLMNSTVFKASWFAKLDRICPIAFWSLCCAALLLGLIILKWYKFDKKNTELTFAEYYGLKCNVKSVLIMLGAAFLGWLAVMIVINTYYKTFNTANFTVALPGLNIPFQLTPISNERLVDWFFYFLYFLPYWIVGSMLVNSARMKDMPEWLNVLIISFVNFLPIALFVYIQFAGTCASGGVLTNLGLKWGTIIQMQGLVIAIPLGVYISRILYKRTGSVLPGAFLNSMVFTLPFMANVVAYTFASMPSYASLLA